MDKITVIIPVYNGENTIERCIDSVLGQTYPELEIIIVNDGSGDRTAEICQRYEKQDQRVSLLTKGNAGVSAARNTGLDHASGKYVLFVDADDHIEKEMIRVLYEKITDEKHTGLVICGCLEEKENEVSRLKTDAKESMNRAELMRALVQPDSVRGFLFNKLFDLGIIRDNEIRMKTEIHVCEDLLFCFEYAMHIEQAVYIKNPLYHYVFYENSASHKKYNEKKFSVIEAFEKIKKITDEMDDPQLTRAVEAHYLVVVIQLFVMLKRAGYPRTSEDVRMILKNIRKRKICLFNTNWHLRYKLVCIPLKILSFTVG